MTEENANPIESILRRMPLTLGLIVLNCIVFVFCYMRVGTFADPMWTIGLLDRGALFNPYTLGGQWYRIFTAMFLHGHIAHLLFNMYALYVAGGAVESKRGTKRFLIIYLLSGVTAALSSLYWGLFTIVVGASGAIFGLFGFSLATDLIENRAHLDVLRRQIINFVVFLGVNLIFAKLVHADTAAHLGGLGCGLILGVCSTIDAPFLRRVRPDAIISGLLLITYFVLPRYQVTYYNFFQQVLHTEDSITAVMRNNTVSTDTFLENYKRALEGWDTALDMLDQHRYLPPELHADTTNLRMYIDLQKKEGAFRLRMVGNESYIYMDSIEWAARERQQYQHLEYILAMTYVPPEIPKPDSSRQHLKQSKIWYDSNWIQVPYPPAAFSRIGFRDSLGRWQGPLTDFFSTGRVQMKGTYKDDLKHGIFIYYTERGTYQAAGRYEEERSVGKWETFHPNGKIETEVFYGDRYFLKSYWDSLGVQMVKDGTGTETHLFANGVVGEQGKYEDGYREGYWYGRHPDGKMYFEEYYRNGRLINGRSTSRTGDVVVYDESTLYALPKGGYPNLRDYIKKRTAAVRDTLDISGVVRIRFRVTVNRRLADMRVDKSVSKQIDDLAKKIIAEGPEWLPARVHGQEWVDGFGFVEVEF